MNKKKYSIPLYENGKPTSLTIDFEEGDEKHKILLDVYNEIPIIINININK